VPRPLVMTVEEPQVGAKWTYVLKRSPVVLGRDTGTCDVAFARPSVSKVQGEIIFDDNKVGYRDLDSRNGSIVDGEPIPADVMVTVSDTSYIVMGGRLRLTFSRDATVRASEGVNPFEAPRIKSALVFEPTAVHVGSLPPPPQVKSPVPTAGPVPSQPLVSIPLYPMPDPDEQPMMTERMPVPAPQPETPPSPSEQAQDVETPVPLIPGDIVAHYRVERLIGRGGMGTVYEVSHTRVSSKRFAMKVLSSEVIGHPEAESRFMREAQAASLIEHPHVVGMVDYGRDRGIAYLTMELLEGEDLGALIARRKLSIERIADIMLAVCSAVARAHGLGVIHRDLKPQNIFLARISTGETVPKVLDFGISKVRLPGDTKITQRFSLLGTPSYVSPEQAEGGPVDARCDVYALGTILYECLTGRRCHEGTTLYGILRSIAEADYPLPSQLVLEVPPDFEAVILKALARKPDDRFSTVFDLGRALFPFASLKRQSSWKDYYFPTGESTASGTFNFIPLSGSKHQASLQPKTELLPEGDAKPLPGPSFRKPSGPPAAIAPSSDSSRRRREAVALVARPEKSRSSSKSAAPAKTGAWLWPVLAGCLLGVVLLVVFLVFYRRPAVEISRPGTAVPQSTAEAIEPVALPPLAGAATVPSPPVPSHEVVVPPAIPVASDPTATSTSKSSTIASPTGHHGASDSQRHVHTKVRDGRSEHQIKRNRSGIPLLEP